MRIPYWDWTSSPEMPALVSEPSIEINGPGGRYNVSNPLYEYAFHPQPPAADFPPGDYVSLWFLVGFQTGEEAEYVFDQIASDMGLLCLKKQIPFFIFFFAL